MWRAQTGLEAEASADDEPQRPLGHAIGNQGALVDQALPDLIDAGQELLQSRPNLLLQPCDFFFPEDMIDPGALQGAAPCGPPGSAERSRSEAGGG